MCLYMACVVCGHVCMTCVCVIGWKFLCLFVYVHMSGGDPVLHLCVTVYFSMCVHSCESCAEVRRGRPFGVTYPPWGLSLPDSAHVKGVCGWPPLSGVKPGLGHWDSWEEPDIVAIVLGVEQEPC